LKQKKKCFKNYFSSNNNNLSHLQQHSTSSSIPSQQQQRILVHHHENNNNQNPLITSTEQMPINIAGNSTSLINIPQQQQLIHSYIGSERFANSILNNINSQDLSPKTKYRELKKKFKYLVYVSFIFFFGGQLSGSYPT
jgi:hypothetical protein